MRSDFDAKEMRKVEEIAVAAFPMVGQLHSSMLEALAVACSSAKNPMNEYERMLFMRSLALVEKAKMCLGEAAEYVAAVRAGTD